MVDTAPWRAELEGLKTVDWPAYLRRHSGLPGPRANTRLLAAAALAADPVVEVCRRTTNHLVGLLARDRRAPAARTLCKSLGFCWSVAVAADPDQGLDAFKALDVSDADVAWIVTQNRRKKRLSSVLGESGEPRGRTGGGGGADH